MDSLQHCENDALLVDDLLDFSCGDIGGLCEEGDDCAVTLCGQVSESNSCFQGASASSYCVEGTVLRTCDEPSEAGELLYSQPDELAGLEWFSSFVEESYKGEDQSIPMVSSEQWFSKSSRSKKEEEGRAALAEEEWSYSLSRGTNSWLRVSNNGTFAHILDMGTSPLIEAPCSTSTKNGSDKRSRSRRRSSRSGGRVWTLMPLSERTPKRPRPVTAHQEQEEEEDLNSQASSLEYEPYIYEAEEEGAQRKKACGGAWEVMEGRRCSHCQVQKTPQWRAGPLGPKTLCNACGVRYKSGRLLPEYRPAASPTFITELHSNSHKKVLEMRTGKSRVAHEKQDQEAEFSSSSCSQESTNTRVHH